MVEGGRIDHAHHLNQAKKAVEETLELERAVLAALELTRRDSVSCKHEVTLIQRYQERELLTTYDQTDEQSYTDCEQSWKTRCLTNSF